MVSSGAREMLINSDYPFDKVIFVKQDSYSAPSGGISSYQIPHGLPFTPLMRAVWSTDPNFSITYNVHDGVLDPNPALFMTLFMFDIRSDATNIYIEMVNGTGTSQLAYFRMWGFMPTNISQTAPFTANLADPFVINSDYNYTKLYSKGITASSSTPGTSIVIPHNLGYYPQCEAWSVRNGYTYDISYTQSIGSTPDLNAVIMGDNSLTLYRSNYLAGTEYFHYRIYLEEL